MILAQMLFNISNKTVLNDGVSYFTQNALSSHYFGEASKHKNAKEW